METASCNQYNYKMPNIRSIRSPSPKAVPCIDNENSPLQIACTQEYNESIDVVWDWNSPQGKKHPRRCQKRLLQSSKIPLKKHPSMQDFEKLRKELQSLNELALPDREENQGKKSVSLDVPIEEFNNEEFDELMDDDINEKLFAISQEVSEQLLKKDDGESSEENFVKSPKFQFKKTCLGEKPLTNDSIDDLLGSVDVDKLTGNSPKEEQYVYTSTQIQTSSGKVEFHRTQSFEIANSISQIAVTKKCTQQQIEQKRKEALAKLESKKKLELHIACSQQDIEKKRLQALAKMEAKRQQEIIERKRQEALKRLEMRRQKNAVMVKSSLVTRLK